MPPRKRLKLGKVVQSVIKKVKKRVVKKAVKAVKKVGKTIKKEVGKVIKKTVGRSSHNSSHKKKGGTSHKSKPKFGITTPGHRDRAGRAKPKPGRRPQSAASRGVIREGKRERTATNIRSGSRKRKHAETTRRQTERSNAGLAAHAGGSNAITAPPDRSGPTRLAKNSDALSRIKSRTSFTKTWDDITQSRTKFQNDIHEVARLGKPSTALLDGRAKSVDPFKMFHKQFNASELTTGMATKIHDGGHGVVHARRVLHNELTPFIRATGGSHVIKVPNPRGLRHFTT